MYTLDPLLDPRWATLVDTHPDASVFHTTEWLEALRQAYGYEPVAYTTSPPGAGLSNGIVLCRINSWLTGRRMVSVPFADHCEPLLDGSLSGRRALLAALKTAVEREHYGYVELRPRTPDLLAHDGVEPSASYVFHSLDLRPSLEKIFAGFHKSTIQRNIRRAEREGLEYEDGNSEALLRKFYGLMLLTRRRHQLPPQPIQWFRNLITCLGVRLTIRVASIRGRSIAGMLTLSHGQTVVYKYGCSDAEFHHLGSMPFLFWKVIQEAKALQMKELDLGRSDSDNPGLITFKGRWGATASTLTYVRSSARPAGTKQERYGVHHLARRAFTLMPDRVLTTAGRLLYRHIG